MCIPKWWEHNSKTTALFLTRFCITIKINKYLLSVLRCCWFGGRKGIQPVKTKWWGTGVVICLERGANYLHMSSWCHYHPIISCFIKIQNGLPFQCWLTQVVLEKRPLNRCSSSSSSSSSKDQQVHIVGCAPEAVHYIWLTTKIFAKHLYKYSSTNTKVAHYRGHSKICHAWRGRE